MSTFAITTILSLNQKFFVDATHIPIESVVEEDAHVEIDVGGKVI